MENRDISVPTVRPLGSVYDVDYSLKTNGQKPLRGIDVMAPGTLVVQDVEGNSAVYDLSGLTAGIPFRLVLQIRAIVGDGAGGVGNGTTGTDIAMSDMIGLH